MPRKTYARRPRPLPHPAAPLPTPKINLVNAHLLRIRHVLLIVALLFLFLLLLAPSLVITPHIIRALPLHNPHRNLDDHDEPQHRQDLQAQQAAEEGPLHPEVPADVALAVEERLDEVPVAGGRVVRARQVVSRARDAAVGEYVRGVGVEGPADHEVEDVAGEDPRDEEDGEDGVAEFREAKVLEALGELGGVSVVVLVTLPSDLGNRDKGTYREENVDHVHEHEYQVADARKVVCVRGEQQAVGDDVVGEHLPVVLAPLLHMDDQELLHPKGPLREHVALDEALQLPVRVVGPQLVEAEEVLRGAINVLRGR